MLNTGKNFALSNSRVVRKKNLNEKINHRKTPSGRAVLTRTTRKDKHRKYSEMRNALKLINQ